MKNPKTILITGASSGIGRALALEYAAPGMVLLLTGRDQNRLMEIESRCRQKGATTHTATLDVAEAAHIARQIEAWDDLNPIDLVIANAGISGGSSGGAAFREILNVNLDGTVNTVEPLIPRMVARGHGQIALMSSMAGWRGMPNAPAYSVSKVAVRAYGEALRPLLKKNGLGVSVIFPGFIKTPLTDKNNFPMPFLISAESAARYIRDGLARNKARIGFPWQMLLISRLVASLPLALGDFILSKAPKKN
jgi:short-subunit dehydrogenase